MFLWREENGVIFFDVTSDGCSCDEMVSQLEKKGVQFGDCAKQVLYYPDFSFTNGITTEVAVLKGNVLFEEKDRTTKNIRSKAYEGVFTDGRKLFNPDAELICLICRKFTNEEIRAMDLTWIVAMHEPIIDSDGILSLLGLSCCSDEKRFLLACLGGLSIKWKGDHKYGFAFAVSKK